MKHSNEREILDFYYVLKDIPKKMKEYREKLLKMESGDDPEAAEVAGKLLRGGQATVGSIELQSNLLLQTYRSATYKNKYLKPSD